MESFEQPLLYTRYEGEKWLHWPPVLHMEPDDLSKRASLGDPTPFVIICGTRVHSLKFNKGVRWDCLNGFTK